MADAGQAPEEAGASENLYRQIIRLKEVHYLALFGLLYVGAEVSIGGWIVTFIEHNRGGGASAGYVSSGFFGGLMLGRVVLIWPNEKIGERWVVFLYSLLVIVFEVTIWVVPSLIGNAIAVSFIGLLLRSVWPIVMNQSTTILPVAAHRLPGLYHRHRPVGRSRLIADYRLALIPLRYPVAAAFCRVHGVRNDCHLGYCAEDAADRVKKGFFIFCGCYLDAPTTFALATVSIRFVNCLES